MIESERTEKIQWLKKWKTPAGSCLIKDRSRFIDFYEVASKRRLWNFLILERNDGKTYSSLLFAVREYIKKGYMTFFVRRYADEIIAEAIKMFDKIVKNVEFPGYEFAIKTTSVKGILEAYIKAPGAQFVKFADLASLSLAMKIKSAGDFPDTHYIIFDEVIIPNKYKKVINYIGGYNEPVLFHELAYSIIRDKDFFQIFLLSNPISSANPYFSFWNVRRQQGQKEYLDKDKYIMFESKNHEAFVDGVKRTMWGQYIAGTSYGKYALDGEYQEDDSSFICNKSEGSTPFCNFFFDGIIFGAWSNDAEGRIYICRKYDETARTFTMTAQDQRPNYLMVKKSGKTYQVDIIKDAVSKGYLYYDSIDTKQRFLDVLRLLGV